MAKDQRMPAAEPLLRPRKIRNTANLPLRQIEMSTLPQPSSRRGRIALGLTVTILTILAFFLVGQASLPAEDGAKPTQRLEIQPGNHICIIGNTLADRMQHDGWLESLLQSRVPQHLLVCRDLGFAADELTTRLRSVRQIVATAHDQRSASKCTRQPAAGAGHRPRPLSGGPGTKA